MKLTHLVVTLFVGSCVNAAFAQAPAAPVAPTPPVAPASPAPPTAPTPPAAPAAVVPPSPPAPPTSTIVEGTLFGTQRVTSERGQFQWICTYRVAGQKRMVQLDESCPSTIPFDIRR